ncbi:UDP-N-acetylmuramoyl-L-alanine--D-glutamate ligase [Allochromatium palmeri]|uniref:UDP-N-acetylmuramoylalanine--D-glutamate ligase n=1 Tax=Allochromatium palmeri TaxID=231048 RepID=A0A6N8EI59_9GAMM|nr:UDP-N-acetylmuramoyl-L-alanine--D-glutamate ligase [Allochromatium palmeri]MTW22004.1 UDP-N-acetylmuramoyl-L-alanine--D-glutamate ligase [Allochromatium palmeri]
MASASTAIDRSLSPEPKTLIVGLGKTGLSCARHLSARGVRVAVTDSRERPPGLERLQSECPEVAVFIGGFDPEVFAAASELVVSPGVPIAEPLIQQAMARGVPAVGDIELFAREIKAPLCAITGSNGKSTVTTLVGLMARLAGRRVAVGGNLGEPVLDLLAPNVELYVIELSSFQLETVPSLRADVAVVLNVSADHLDRYPSLDDYARTKARLYQGARIAVVNRDDPIVAAMPRDSEREIGFTLGRPEGTDFGVRVLDGQPWICQGEEPILPTAEVRIPGRHNLANALAALALAHASAIPMASAREALRAFPGLSHRSEFVAERAGACWYDDSKGTNPGATMAALDGLIPAGGAGRVVLIAGGEGKGADFTPLRAAVERAARAVVLIGRDAPLIESALSGTVPLIRAADMDEAVELAAERIAPGDCVLLSPACASFDMFDNYEHRGQVFAEAVRRLSP